jgi:deoxyhypusine synthase
VVDAAKAYEVHMEAGGKMMVTLAGAMSTAELGLSLAELIRPARCTRSACTGANLEEDVFNLVAHRPLRAASPTGATSRGRAGGGALRPGMNRVTDTCIPEHEAFRRDRGSSVVAMWQRAEEARASAYFPHEYYYQHPARGQEPQGAATRSTRRTPG